MPAVLVSRNLPSPAGYLQCACTLPPRHACKDIPRPSLDSAEARAAASARPTASHRILPRLLSFSAHLCPSPGLPLRSPPSCWNHTSLRRRRAAGASSATWQAVQQPSHRANKAQSALPSQTRGKSASKVGMMCRLLFLTAVLKANSQVEWKLLAANRIPRRMGNQSAPAHLLFLISCRVCGEPDDPAPSHNFLSLPHRCRLARPASISEQRALTSCPLPSPPASPH